MGKYSALRDHLEALDENHWKATFKDIEEVLGFRLPQSARNYQAWWANQRTEGHVQCRSWLDAGWETYWLNLESEKVTFVNVDSRNVRVPAEQKRSAEIGWTDVLLESETDPENLFRIKFAWSRLGNVLIDGKERLLFPKTPFRPSVYRLTIIIDGQRSVYVGETDEISRRLQHYRTPGITQRTNQRLNSLMMKALNEGGSVEVSVIERSTVHMGNSQINLDMDSKYIRRLFENLAIVNEQQAGAVLLNQ